MRISSVQYAQSAVSLTAALVPTGVPFTETDLRSALAQAGEIGSGVDRNHLTEAVARFFHNPATGQMSVKRMLDSVIGVSTATHLLSRSGDGWIITAIGD